MSRITLRFWVSSYTIFEDIIGLMPQYSDKYLNYYGDKHPYKANDGRFVVLCEDFDNVEQAIKDLHEFASISEILVGDKWFIIANF